MGLPLNSTACAMCGQCTVVCPTGALTETDGLTAVWAALSDPKKRVVVQTAPAVRAALGEEFGYPVGTPVTGQMAAALHELGFDDVFDTNFAADLTILEEGTELLQRLKTPPSRRGEAALPMITSCSPGWIKHIEHAYPDELDHLSTCKSPHTMLGALTKSYYAEKLGIDPRDIFTVSIMPCTAKKYEIQRPEMERQWHSRRGRRPHHPRAGADDQERGHRLPQPARDELRRPPGASTGAADIFGVTGGVMEAALRTVYELVTGRELPFEGLHVTPIVGLEQVKRPPQSPSRTLCPPTSILEGVTVNIAVTSGLAGADILMGRSRQASPPTTSSKLWAVPAAVSAAAASPAPTARTSGPFAPKLSTPRMSARSCARAMKSGSSQAL